jgi:hypothetical protein
MADNEMEKAKIAYSKWRQEEVSSRRTNCSIVTLLSVVGSTATTYLIDANPYLTFAAVLPGALVGLLGLVEGSRAEQIPYWSNLLQEFEYEAWRIAERRKL